MKSQVSNLKSQMASGCVVAIVGRPNVGKSAIFNRFAGRRAAIVHEQSGVTRDRLACEVTWGNRRFELIDTGGIGNIDNAAPRTAIDAGIRLQVDMALREATAVIFVVDLQAGIVPLDQEVAGILRPCGLNVFIAANKADDPGVGGQAVDFERFGFPAFPVSALHNTGLGVLMDAVAACLPAVEDKTAGKPLRVAVVGRPNVGKSSYINRLLRSDRVIVSDTPGTTRDSVDIPFAVGSGPNARRYVLIDTAGIRRRGKVEGALERFSLLRAENSIKSADIAVLIVDALDGVTVQDRKIADKVQRYEKGCVLVINKWDLSKMTQRKYDSELGWKLAGMDYVPVVYISAKTGYNIRETVDAIDRVAAQVRSELSTGVLNRTLTAAYKRVLPPLIKGKKLKMFYATQVGIRPVRIVLFVNDPKRIQPAYKAYLVKALRNAFGLEGAPVVLEARSRRKKTHHAH